MVDYEPSQLDTIYRGQIENVGKIAGFTDEKLTSGWCDSVQSDNFAHINQLTETTLR